MPLIAHLVTKGDAAVFKAAAMESSAGADTGFSYDYKLQGQDWQMGQCTSRQEASPIDFAKGTPLVPLLPLSFKYEPIMGSFEMVNNGHVYYGEFAGLGLGGVISAGNWYNLMNINIHAQSEHTWKGVHYPVEMHLVHKASNSEHMLIIAIPFECAAPPPILLQFNGTDRGGSRAERIWEKAAREAFEQGGCQDRFQNEGTFKASQSGRLRASRYKAASLDQQMPWMAAPTTTAGPTTTPPPPTKPPIGRPWTGGAVPMPPTTTPAAAPGPAPVGVYAGPCSPPIGYKGYTPPPAAEADFNPQLQKFLTLEPPPVNMKSEIPVFPTDPLDLNVLLDGQMLWKYSGGLTGPPCAELVSWFVMVNPIKASNTQVAYIHDGIFNMNNKHGNNRATMPLNGRTVGLTVAKKMEPPPPSVGVDLPTGQSGQTDREIRALKWAKDALHIARSSSNYVADLDSRLQNAAQAHMQVFEPQPILPGMGPAPAPAGPPTVSPMELAKSTEALAASISEAARETMNPPKPFMPWQKGYGALPTMPPTMPPPWMTTSPGPMVLR